MAHTGPSGLLSAYAYVLDAAGRITSVANSANSSESWNYGYDALNQLISATNAGNSSLTQSFAYAPNGNIIGNSAHRLA